MLPQKPPPQSKGCRLPPVAEANWQRPHGPVSRPKGLPETFFQGFLELSEVLRPRKRDGRDLGGQLRPNSNVLLETALLLKRSFVPLGHFGLAGFRSRSWGVVRAWGCP